MFGELEMMMMMMITGVIYLGGVGGAGYKRHKKTFANELTGNEFKVLMSDIF